MAKRKRRRKAAVGRTTRGGRRGARRARRAGLSQVVSGLQKYRSELLGERKKLESQLAAVDAALRSMGAAVAAPRPAGRPGRAPARGPARAAAGAGPRPGSLKDHIIRVLSRGGTMSVKDITAGVLASGYKTTNKTLPKSVGIALAEMPTVRRVARGRFRLK